MFGWIGALSFITSYALLSFGWLKSNSFIYHFMNVIGGLCLIVNALQLLDVPNVFINLIWVGIAVFSIGKNFFEKKVVKFKVNEELKG